MTDFGMSKMVEANPRMTRSKVTQCPGTPVFMPPEALRARPRYSDKLDTFSLGVLMVQTITRCFPTPTDAEIVVEDETSPTGEKILPVPELQRRQRDIGKVPPDHSLLPTALHCLKHRPKDRPSAAQLCQSLGQLKTSEIYTASKAEDQQRRLEQQLRLKEEEKDAEIAQLQEQIRQLATEKNHLASEKDRLASEKDRLASEKDCLASEKDNLVLGKEREVTELRRQLQKSERAPAEKDRKSFFGFLSRAKPEEGSVSRPKVIIT